MFHKRASALAIIAGSLLFVSFAWAKMLPPVASDNAKSGAQFSDVASNHPFVKTIGELKKNGLVKGYADGTFAPDSSVTRAEFITMVMAGTDASLTDQGCFKDVPKGEWFSKFVCTAKARRIISGYADGSFKPYNNINFAEASAIIAKAYKLNPGKAKKSEAWYKPAVQKIAARSAIPVTIDFMEKRLSRGETGEILWRLKAKIKNRPTKTFETLTEPLPVISSCPELKEKLAFHQYKQIKRRSRIFMPGLVGVPSATMMEIAEGEEDEGEGEGAAFPESEGPESAPAKAGESFGTASPDFSSTNVQVAGVDEGDIVKNDGSHIYIVSRKSVRVVKANPPGEMKEVAKLDFEDNNFFPNDLYTTSDKLVVMGTSWKSENSSRHFNSSYMKVLVYAMDADRNLSLERTVEFEGKMLSSRRIGSRLYLVMQNSPDIYRILPMEEGNAVSWNVEDALPFYSDSQIGKEMPVVPCGDVRFFPHYEDVSQTVVASFDISNPSSEVKSAMVMGAGSIVYASLESLYVAGTRWEYPVLEKFDVWAPPASGGGEEKTVLFRFALDPDGSVTFKTTGEVPGHPLNQFSLDEEGTALRIATTTGEVWDSRNPSENHLYILDKENLATMLGRIEGIAPGEKIYSVRFLGKRAYMVTFKKIDPFFVIDVEDPSNPKILGALKIPGYSDYLHPYDENHIIGFGKEAVDPTELEKGGFNNSTFDFAWYQGMKIALFDVTDVANPKLMFKELVGDRGTESELLRDHKALLYDKARNIFAFPVTVAKIESNLMNEFLGARRGNTYGNPEFQGAYVYTLDIENGFKFKGRVTHYTPENFNKYGGNYFYPDDRYDIRRIVSIGDYLYTVSQGMLKAVKREDMNEVNMLDFQLPDNGGGGWYE